MAIQRKWLWLAGGTILIVVGVAGLVSWKWRQSSQVDAHTVSLGSVVEQVSVAGTVKPVTDLDLTFDVSGRVVSVGAKVGDTVQAGQLLVALDSRDVVAQLRQAQADVAAAQAQLNELQNGTRPEEIQIAITVVANAERSVAEAQNNVDTVNAKAVADYNQVLAESLNVAQEAVLAGKQALLVAADLRYAYYNQNNQESIAVRAAIDSAAFELLGVSGAGNFTSSALSDYNGGAFGEVQASINNVAAVDVPSVLTRASRAIVTVRDVYNVIPLSTEMTSVDRASSDTQKSTVATKISAISAAQQSISLQLAINNNNMAAAKSSFTTASNNLASAQRELQLKQAGNTPSAIAAQRARVSSAQARVASVSAQASKYQLRSPFAGVVVARNVEVGEIVVQREQAVMSLEANGLLQVEIQIPEIDFAKVAVGTPAAVSLDAYDESVTFEAEVASIDPAATVTDNVPSYKVTLIFKQPDNRLRSGMTANVVMTTARHDDVVVIPLRLLTNRSGAWYTRVIDGANEQIERQVTLGLRGSDGLVEVVTGLSVGDRVVTPTP